MDLADELRASLQEFLASGTIEIHDPGGRATPA